MFFLLPKLTNTKCVDVSVCYLCLQRQSWQRGTVRPPFPSLPCGKEGVKQSYLMMLLQLRKRRCKQGRRSSSVYKERRTEAKRRDGWMWRRGDALERGTASSQLCILLHSLSHLAALCSCIQHLHPLCACTHSHGACCPCLHMGRRGGAERENERARREREREGRAESVLR